MFLHIFKYRLKSIIRDKQALIWVFIFPIILGTLFKLAIPDTNSTAKFKTINIAVVTNNEYENNVNFKTALDSVSNENKTDQSEKMFNVYIAEKAKAEELLKNSEIDGYILFDNGPHIVVKESGFNQTIIKGFVDDYLQITSQYENILKNNPSAIKNLMNQSNTNIEYIKEISPGKTEPNDSLVYYYALIGMTCLYGGFIGLKEITNIQADQSAQGCRLNLAPVSKLKLFGCSILASACVQIFIIFTLILYLKYIIKIDLGNQVGFIVLAGIASSLTGVSFGTMIGSIVKGSEVKKFFTVLSLTMIMSFFAGLQVAEMKYMITEKFPIMAYINPANVISDSFYSLYYYDTYTRYFTNIGILIGFTVIFYVVTLLIVRRQKYASI